MHPQIEEYIRPQSLDDAVAILRDPNRNAIPVAGATEIGLRVRKSIRTLVDLADLGLDKVWQDDAGLHLGAMVRAAQISDDSTIRQAIGDALPEAAFAIAGQTIRNLTSLGGNIIHLTYWSDMPIALQALDASFRVQGTSDRTYSCAEFLAGQPQKHLNAGDLVTEVIIPPTAARSGSAFLKHAKTAVDFALVNTAAYVALDGDTISDVRLSVGAIHTPPIRLPDAEALALGSTLDDTVLKNIQEAVRTGVSPRRDVRASEGYLRHCAGVVVRRALVLAADRARGENRS